MKPYHIISTLIIITLFSCNNALKREESVHSNTQSVNKSDLIEDYLDCEDENFESIKKQYLDSIAIIKADIISYTSTSKLDSIRKNAFITILKNSDSSFNNFFISESDLIFWSYGSTSTTGERRVSANCYYLHLLKNRMELMKFLLSKIQSTAIQTEDFSPVVLSLLSQ